MVWSHDVRPCRDAIGRMNDGGAFAIRVIVVVNDIRTSSGIIPVEGIVRTLLNQNLWLFPATIQLIGRLREGDRAIVYFAGQKRAYFGASFTLAQAPSPLALKPNGTPSKVLACFFKYWAPVQDAEVWDDVVPISDVKEHLDFIGNKKDWGLYFRQTLKCISEQDYQRILSKRPNTERK